MPLVMPPEAMSPTATSILDAAERLAQTRGFNGFSYADISVELGITKASLHYHFRTKAELGRRLMARYHDTFADALREISDSGAAAPEMLGRYARLYADVLRRNRMCLCGIFAAEYTTLPPPMQGEIRRFFDLNEAWLAEVAERGRAAGTLTFEGTSWDLARLLLAALEGAMLVARTFDDAGRFEASSDRLLQQLGARPLALRIDGTR